MTQTHCIFCLKPAQAGQTICNVCDARRTKLATEDEAKRYGGSGPPPKADLRSVENKQYGDPPREGCGRKGPFKESPLVRFELDELEESAIKLAVKQWRERNPHD